MFEAFLVSTTAVAVAEIGDKTQLLAIVLAARYRKPVPILFGILGATLLNHALAGLLGAWLTSFVGAHRLKWILGISFMLMAVWALVPDKYEEQEASPPRYGVFLTTLAMFFVVEIGDKTQIATVALAANYASLVAVVVGTTFGMMIANAPAVWFGEVAAQKVPLKWVRAVAAGLFFLLGLWVILQGNFSLGGG